MRAPAEPSFGVAADDEVEAAGADGDEFSHDGLLASCLNSGHAPLACRPPGLRLDLKGYQLQTVRWMQEMEGTPINRFFWEERRLGACAYFFSPGLGELRLALPGDSYRGGMLASDMGLGKTVMILSLIALDKAELAEGEPRRPTLVLAPPPLVSQWVAESDRCFGSSLTVRLLDDLMPLRTDARGRNGGVQKRLRDISHVDVVIASYHTLKEASRKGSGGGAGLFDQQWRRVVCDECQEVRNGHQLLSKGARRLLAQRRWLCSGTPIFNSIDDIHGELAFINIVPFSLPETGKAADGFFSHRIRKPWDARCPDALALLRALLRTVMIRCVPAARAPGACSARR